MSTKGNDDMLDVTPQVGQAVTESGVRDGVVSLFVVGSTAALTTIEYEPGLERDFPEALEKLAPKDGHYDHEARWNDDNGHSHVRASLIGPSLTVPVVSGQMALGTWQQIVLVDFDTRPRDRTVVTQIIGD